MLKLVSKIHPNVISFASLLMAVAAFFSVKNSLFIYASLFVLLNGGLDYLDGKVARFSKKTSVFGKLLDRTIDKISEALILSSFIMYGFVDTGLGLYTLSAVLIATTIASNIEVILGDNDDFRSLMMTLKYLKALRFLVLVALTALQEFYWMFFCIAVIVTFSIALRLIKLIYYLRSRSLLK